MKLRLRPEAMGDIRAAMAWYEEREAGLAAAFLEQIDMLFERIAEHPARFPTVYKEFRRAFLRRFPYAVYFLVEGEAIIVFAILHQRRDRALLGERG
ncbi:MAG: type II toxin-antitoxin system RelE/ParE family toxin [Rhodomicrobium sp.]|nr:type II toxin-antitoxin system RelE/ParE family toxin [Rhodomicrobium sp.]